MNPDFSRMTPHAAKCYREGLAQVRAKLAAHHVPTAEERHLASIREGERLIRHKLASAKQSNTLASPSTTPQAPEPQPRAAFRQYSIAGTRKKRLFCGGGLFA